MMAAKSITYYEASSYGIWPQNILHGGIDWPLKLFHDNKSAVLNSNNNRGLTKSKNIDIKFLVIKEKVKNS